jgi:hypothetical protein
MTYTSISKGFTVIALLLAGMFVTAAPARAQSSDTWKSIAIIGGSTAAGAYIGHRVAGSTGAYIGAAAGAATGYAIDRRRRQNEYNNGYYGNNGGYYGSNDPYGNGGYYGNNGPYNNGGYYGGPGGYPSGYGNGFASRARRR